MAGRKFIAALLVAVCMVMIGAAEEPAKPDLKVIKRVAFIPLSRLILYLAHYKGSSLGLYLPPKLKM